MTTNKIMLPEAKHTPGPWAVEPCTHMVWGPAPSIDTRTWGNFICEAKSTDRIFGKLITPSEAGANARLISKAPELIDALILAANRLQIIAVELISDGNDAHYQVSEWVDDARSVIIKALK